MTYLNWTILDIETNNKLISGFLFFEFVSMHHLILGETATQVFLVIVALLMDFAVAVRTLS